MILMRNPTVAELFNGDLTSAVLGKACIVRSGIRLQVACSIHSHEHTHMTSGQPDNP